ncbi:MAG TPA: hypothetical protein VFP36_05520 [Usitatibacter sp.]|nr:hypothetical protein [Usitatibacter sp.]
MPMETISKLEAAVLAAGITTVYIADDWERIAGTGASQPADAAPGQSATPTH